MFKVPKLDDFVGACGSFHDTEGQVSAFSVVLPTVQKGNKAEGIFILLKIWNQGWSIRFSMDVLKKQIKDAIKDLEGEGILEELKGESLLTVNLSEKSNKIREGYKILRRKKAINMTGATKALHLLNHDLFMMWDSEIRETYHSDWFEENHKGTHKCGSPDCYLEFMKNCQTFARKLVEQEDEEKIIERHLQDFQDIDNDKNWESSETLAKMIDEYNYMQITHLKRKWRR